MLSRRGFLKAAVGAAIGFAGVALGYDAAANEGRPACAKERRDEPQEEPEHSGEDKPPH